MLAVCVFTVLSGLARAHADEFSWNSGNGSWYNASNWAPNGIPTTGDVVFVGNLPGVQNSTVLLGSGITTAAADHLEITNGMILDLNNTEWVATGVDGDVLISGANSRMIVRPQGPALNFHDFNGTLVLGPQSFFELTDGAEVRISENSVSDGIITGTGNIQAGGGVNFVNNGIIRPNGNGEIAITIVSGLNNNFDLDGTTGNGHLQLNQLSSLLEVNAEGLLDPFSGTISLAADATLTMNVDAGWVADGNSTINVTGFNNPAAASKINGTALSFGGELNVGGAQGHLRVLAPLTFQSTAEINIGVTDQLELDGFTTVQGGQFTLAQDGIFKFDSQTTMQGGVFTTHNNSAGDGFISFNGPTTWNGNVTVNGVARQQGNATVSGNTTINAGVIDLDGLSGNTAWDINALLAVNAEGIDTAGGNSFDGIFDVGVGIFAQLAINLDQPDQFWTMAGQLFLANNLPFSQTRVSGSPMQIVGDLFVNGANVRITADTDFADSSSTVFQTVNTSLVMIGTTTVEAGALFMGEGTFINGTNGNLRLQGSASLNELGLRNQGLLEIGDATGIADVASFESTSAARWQVEIGGHVAGTEHDVLLVGNGDAILAGRLSVKLVDAGNGLFVPQVGDEFTILSTVDSVIGQFDNAPISIAGGNGYLWEVLYHSNDVTLRVASIIPNLVLGDVNLDGVVSLLDVSPFVNAITSGTYIIQADINCDGAVNLLDVSLFVALLTG